MSERIEAEWLEAAPARAVTGMLEAAGHQAWFVGGCVRNALLDAPVSDLDLTTDARLERVVELAREAGLHTAPQGWWRSWPDTARKHLDFPEDEQVLVGMSMGYGNPDAAVNDLYADRAKLEELVHFYV